MVFVRTFKTSENFIKINDFLSGLHVLVGFVDRTKVAFKAQLKLIYDDRPIVYVDNGKYSKGKSGKFCLKATTCKSMQTRGQENLVRI